jgi:tripartite-type tricarboxylate transporter receptor subunit TctC
MNLNRRQLSGLAGATAITALLPLGAQAQGSKKLTIVVGFPPGGAPDTVARAVAEGLRAQGYTALVENKAGAGGRLAAESLRAAPADGSTVMIAPAGGFTIYPHIYTNLRYDPLKDFAPVATAGQFDFGMAVGPAVPASVKTVADFIAWAKANPNKAQFGSPGGGTAMHFLGIELGRAAKLEFNHIPYRGGAPAMSDLMGGQVPAIFTTLPLLIKPHQANKLRILAHSGDERAKAIPDVPTFKEAGFPAMTMSEMFVVVASAKTPEAVRNELATALAAAISAPSVKAVMEAAEFDLLSLPPAKISARLQSEWERWGKVVKATGYKAED